MIDSLILALFFACGIVVNIAAGFKLGQGLNSYALNINPTTFLPSVNMSINGSGTEYV
jgi:hypothetical protein